MSIEEYVEKVCSDASDKGLVDVIQFLKDTPFVGLFDNGQTYYDIAKEYFPKYLKKYGRKNITI
jgi:hypothetical protein